MGADNGGGRSRVGGLQDVELHDNDLPVIVVTADVKAVVDDAERAMLEMAGGPVVYQRGGKLVRILRDESTRPPGILRPKNAPFIAPHSFATLRELMASCARFAKRAKPAKDGQGGRRSRGLSRVLPPDWCVSASLERGAWRLPALESVIEAPTLRPDGSVLDRPGYDQATGIIFEPGDVKFPPVPEKPTIEQARLAIKALADPFCDFPFARLCDLSAALATILSLVGRVAIDGPVPMAAVRASTRATGKTRLADTIVTLATGHRPTVMSPPPRDDGAEWKKTIQCVALEGHAAVLLDNVEGTIGNGELAAALTATTYGGRVLGAMKTAGAPLRAVWICTGNNIRFAGDLVRRVLPIDLDARCEFPEDRTGFKYQDLLGHVLTVRPALVVAALTVLRGFMVAGRPVHGGPQYASYETWDATVRSALIWAGQPDPIEGREHMREEDDEDRGDVGRFLELWDAQFGNARKTLAEVVKDCTAAVPDSNGARLLAFLKELAPGKAGADVNARSAGRRLLSWRGRIVDGRKLIQDGKRQGVQVWRVVSAAGGYQGSTGFVSDADTRKEGDEQGETVGRNPPNPPNPPDPGPRDLGPDHGGAEVRDAEGTSSDFGTSNPGTPDAANDDPPRVDAGDTGNAGPSGPVLTDAECQALEWFGLDGKPRTPPGAPGGVA